MAWLTGFRRRLEEARTFDYLKWVREHLEKRPELRAIPYWVAAVAVGFVAVIYSSFFSRVIERAQDFAVAHPYIFLAWGPLCFAVGASIVFRFAPAAGGSGVAKVHAAVLLDSQKEQATINSFLSLRVALVIVLSSIVTTAGGGSMGREGPIVQISACVFYFIGRQFSVLWPYQEHRSWIIAGGAAGVAAAFNTPLAGIVFVLEELAQQHFHQFKTVVISAVIISGMIAQWLWGRYLFLGFPKLAAVGPMSVVYAAIVGSLCGGLAGSFERVRSYFDVRLNRLFPARRVLLAAFLGLIVSAIAVFIDRRTIGGGIGTIEDLLRGDLVASWKILAGRFFGVTLTSLSGASGGLLAPALSLGAIVGSLSSQWISPGDHNLMVLVGMAGFLSAMTRAPFTALVIVMEMTDRHSIIFPLMVASLVGLGTNRLVAGKR